MLPKDAIPIRQLRYRGLKAWRVPQIISALPILLQVAVILFFIGILDLLWTLNRTVAGIVTCVVAFPLIVLFFTAVAPALQAFTISTIDPQRIIAQCPYKSPQAWLFYLALQPSVRCLRFFSQSLSTLQAYWWSAREYGVKKCLRMMRRGHLMNSLRQKLREDFAWVLNENTGQFEAKEGWLELDHCWHEIQGGELLGIDTINGISWIIDHFGHRLDVFKSLDLALDDLDDKSVKMLVHKREKDDLSEFISGGDKECLSLFILHQLPIHQHERLRRYLIRRLVDCINKSPELSAKLFNSEDIIEPFFKYYCNNTKAFPNADERALMKCLIAFSAAKPHSHMPFWVLTHPLKLPSFNLIKEDGGLDDVQLQTCFHTLTLFGSLLDGGRRDHPGSAELLSSNSHRNWLGRCQKQLLALPINDDDRRKWQEQKVWGDMKSLIDLVDEQLAQHWPEGRTEDWAQWVGDATGRDATTSVVHTPVYRHKLPSDVIDREREATGLSREESGPGGHGHYSIRNGYLNEPSGQNPGPDSSSHRYSSLRSADPDLDTNELTRYTSFRRGS
ncbi:hypothetical protein AX16_010181 [Volvariella volvacea WC 439]|nr:hypothetical protein AX16_010181 [Volvariella volvacea WC 439]